MFLQINLDTIRRRHHGVYQELPRENSEHTFGPLLIQLHKKQPLEEIYVLNGPGSFTNLRLGCLVVNTLHTILSEPIKIYTINKRDFWHICHEHQAVPQDGVLYIGQRKNAWHFDASTLTYEKKTLESLADLTDIYWEDTSLRDTENKASLDFSTSTCDVTFNGQTTSIPHSDFPRTSVTTITPHYLIQPNISKPKKKTSLV